MCGDFIDCILEETLVFPVARTGLRGTGRRRISQLGPRGQLKRGGKPKMTEDEYYAGEFTECQLNRQADIADYRRAVEEFFLEHQDHTHGVSAVS